MNPGDLAEATRRAEYLAEHGPTVVVMSQQAGFAGLSVVWVAATAPAAFRPDTLVWFLLAVAGAVVAVTVWVRARRRHTLVPYVVETPEQPLAALVATDRKLVGRQVGGRAPVTPDTAPLVRALLEWQRRSTRNSIPMLVGLSSSLSGLGGYSMAEFGGPRWLLLVLLGCVAALMTVLTVVEGHRRGRVLAALEREPAPAV
ncbi:hypothetical protein [Curtobacterium oceanosedimentum]|uniref:hypothetical protein n=1 Tax=Curtobacterium oceanosedimentum TaxID=465820 RepID=UPI001CE0EDA1|nr:hypothetical protein [Curtobacterium oceanosedimentum]MCA5922527.1 hypothetical protein [Curtobacterium oceanosedimentum]